MILPGQNLPSIHESEQLFSQSDEHASHFAKKVARRRGRLAAPQNSPDTAVKAKSLILPKLTRLFGD